MEERNATNLLSDWRTPANFVTMIRGLLTIPIVLTLIQQDAVWNYVAVSLFVIAAASDGLDGYLARSRGEESALGMLLDPVADKVLSICVFGVLVWIGALPTWMLWALVVKELALLIGGVILLRLAREVPQARPLGKWATFIIFVGIVDVMGGFVGVGSMICGIGVVMSLGAGVEYALIALRGDKI